MKNASTIAFLFVLAGCSGSLPETSTNDGSLVARSFFEGRSVVLCETAAGARSCSTPEQGISANGLGGLFLPITAEITSARLDSEDAEISLLVNEISARCSNGTIDWDQAENEVRLRGFLCNWLAIGNVAANLTLTVDWSEPSGRFGGRYAVGFNGTGNGAGSGHYLAEVE